jgi:SAM-dependent methyltransferase
VGSTLYDSPKVYDLLFGQRRSDLEFYLELARGRSRPILELGVGTGRVALALARAGHSVLGVDSSAEMLDELAEALAAQPLEVQRRLRRVRADVSALELAERFELILYPFNGLADHHDVDVLVEVLEGIRRHLVRPSGRLAFDLWRPDPKLLLEGGRGGAYVPWFRDPRTGEVCRSEQITSFDPETSILTITTQIWAIEGDDHRQELTLELHHLPRGEVEPLLEAAQLLLERRVELGDVTGYVCRSAE